LVAVVRHRSFAIDRSIAETTNSLPLQLESKISLGDVRGRIDHMAIDLPRTLKSDGWSCGIIEDRGQP